MNKNNLSFMVGEWTLVKMQELVNASSSEDSLRILNGMCNELSSNITLMTEGLEKFRRVCAQAQKTTENVERGI